MAIEKLQGIESKIDLVTEDRQYFCFIFPVFQTIQPSRLIGGFVFLLSADLNPLVHGDRAFLKEQILDGAASGRKVSSRRRTLCIGGSGITLLSDQSGARMLTWSELSSKGGG